MCTSKYIMGRRRRVNEKLNCGTPSAMSEHEKGFSCDDKDEDRRGISPLQMPVIPTFVADQTPTPTRFLRSLEDAGLFNEICRSSYADDFKRQSSSEESPGHLQAENSTTLALPSRQHAPIPSVILESVADEVEEDISTNDLLHEDNGSNFVALTVQNTGSNLVYGTEKVENVPTDCTIIEQSAEQRVIQVLLNLPNVGLIPINIPADALAQATIPVATSPVISVSSSIPQTIAPFVASSAAQPGITSSVKQKLKATVQQNLQHQQSHPAPSKLQWHQPQPTPPPSNSTTHPPVLKQQQPALNLVPATVNRLVQHNILPASSTGPSVAKTPKLSSTSGASRSTQVPSEVVDVSQTRSSRSSDDEDGEEKRKKFLESNRAAANRCRQKKKQWITSLEEKTKQLLETNKSLTSETAQLRKEITQLKQALMAHKDCPPITIIASNI